MVYRQRQEVNTSKIKKILVRKDMSRLCLNFNGLFIPSRNQAKPLGVNIDNSLKLEAHINELCRKVNQKVQAFGRLRPFLRENKLKLLSNSVVLSNF